MLTKMFKCLQSGLCGVYNPNPLMKYNHLSSAPFRGSQVTPSHPFPSILLSHTNLLHVLHYIGGLPFFLSSFVQYIHYPSSAHMSPNHLTHAIPVMCSCLILSLLVTPNENINIFNSATFACLFVSDTMSKLCITAGLNIIL